MDPLFQVHRLNQEGLLKAEKLANEFEDCLIRVSEIVGPTPSREASLMRTHMELASFYAKKSMASNPANQV